MNNMRLRSILEDRLYVFALITLALQKLHGSMTEDDLVKAVKEHFKEIEEEDIKKYKHQLHLAGFISFFEAKEHIGGERVTNYWMLTEKGRYFLSLVDPRYLKGG